jgi:hypothetical protein
MSTIEDRLRTFAATCPIPPTSVDALRERSTKRRVRRRRRVAVAVAAALVVISASGALAIGRSRPTTVTTGTPTARPRPPGSTTAMPVTSTTTATPPTPDCTSGMLTTHGHLGAGGTGTGLVTAWLSNTGSTACLLESPTSIQLLATDGTPLALHTEPAGASQPTAVVVPPGQPDAVHMDLGWGNWCAPSIPSLSLRISITGGGTVTVPLVEQPTATFTPRCDQPDQPSSIVLAYLGP